ncbi:hypothetical protein [Mucilaginibacter sp. L3T2-6]|uniref:hypothetical protein n=1 Tax=Mucilaginibacter sp. L3T2-6 TaxID=3062491 RepID=UPI0026774A2C|nr:hypothetical protein [Mucilaginibacter sp. L3T2-6]MDO3642213.1 hypothetical protein [Mucilaginibacter sp. L3T2-6]MDV6214708.1 hypothetical protein [Mucilaginibacter sp. L3T2-6]
MSTVKLSNAATWSNQAETVKQLTFLEKYNRFTDGQAKNRTAWFYISLVSQGVLFLPIPALLSYYFNAPIIVLIISLSLYFANIIAGMGGSGIRTIIHYLPSVQ